MSPVRTSPAPALSVVNDKCRHGDGHTSNAVIVLSSNDMEILNSKEAREMALREAGRYGVSGGGITGDSGTFLVDPDGSVADPFSQKKAGSHYRREFKVRSM